MKRINDMYKFLIIVFALLLLDSSVATADTTSTATSKSRSTALASSLLCTLVPAAAGAALILDGSYSGQNDKAEALAGFAIGSTGIVLGPGVGHAYTEKMGRFWGGVAIRGTVAALTAVISFSASGNSLSMSEGIAQSSMALAVGGSVCLVSAICDISAIGASVDEYNKKHGFSSLTLKPTYIATYKAPGLVLKLTF
jgi:hypothetical protein